MRTVQEIIEKSKGKGNRIELLAKKQLEAEGYLVQQAPKSTKWNRQVDLFGLFDLIAFHYSHARNLYHKLQMPDDVFRKFIQVKSNRLPTKKEKVNLKRFKSLYLHDKGESVEWWTYWDRGKRKNKQGWEKIKIRGL